MNLCLFALLGLTGCVANTVAVHDTVVVHDESGNSVSAPGGHSRAMIKKVAPDYPGNYRKAGITGTVVVRIWIDRSGAVAGADIISSPHQELSALAVAAIKQWVFEPDLTAPQEYLVMAIPIIFDVKKP